MLSAVMKQAAARTHASKLNWRPATPVTTAATETPRTTMKNMPKRSVTCETTIGDPASVPHEYGGTQKSIASARPQRMKRAGSGTKIETTHMAAVRVKVTM